MYLNASYLTAETIDEVVEFSRKSGTPFPLKYDAVISCLGGSFHQAFTLRPAVARTVTARV